MKSLVLATLLIVTQALAQLPQNWSPNFAAPEVNGEVLAVAESVDAYYIGGVFTRVGNVPANAIARIDKATGIASYRSESARTVEWHSMVGHRQHGGE